MPRRCRLRGSSRRGSPTAVSTGTNSSRRKTRRTAISPRTTYDAEEGGEDAAGRRCPPLEGDGSDEMQLLQRLLERKGTSRALKEELQEIRRDAAADEGLSDMDRRYLQALARRLSVR